MAIVTHELTHVRGPASHVGPIYTIALYPVDCTMLGRKLVEALRNSLYHEGIGSSATTLARRRRKFSFASCPNAEMPFAARQTVDRRTC